MDGALGVTTVLLGKLSLDDAIQKHPDSDLHVLTSGAIPPNPADLVQSHAMRDLLAEAKRRYDVVIIDAPPLLPVTDGALLAAQADGAVLVIRHGKTTKDQIATARGPAGAGRRRPRRERPEHGAQPCHEEWLRATAMATDTHRTSESRASAHRHRGQSQADAPHS